MGIIEDAVKSQKEVGKEKQKAQKDLEKKQNFKNNQNSTEKSENNTKEKEAQKQEPLKEFEEPPENNSKPKTQEKKSVNDMTKDDFIKWFYELDKDSGPVAGGKGANLGEMYNNKIPVPPGFVVTAQAYDYFIQEAGIKDKIKEILDSIDYEDTKQLNEATEKIRKLITDSSMPEEMQEEIKEAYEHLNVPGTESGSNSQGKGGGTALDILQSSSEPVFVAVRSSATTEDLESASFAGQQETYLNVKGGDDLLKNVKKCFASLFTARATYYRNKQGFPRGESSLAVIVQKMVDSKKSGVSFSKDPTGKTEDTIIEAVWGLGEGIVSGQVTPDKYIVSKAMEIKDKKIAEKKVAVTRKASGERTVVKVNKEKSKQQVLTEHEIKRMAEISLRLEDHYQKPQDIEFAIEDEEIYIVQTRPVTTIKKGKKSKEGEEETEISGEVIVSGLGASPGVAVGKVKVIEDLDDLDKVKQGDILVTGMTNPDMVVAMQRSSGIVTDEGGMTAHAAIVSREMGIPCIVGTGDATEKLEDGDEITVDANSGKVFKGKVAEESKKEIKPVEAETKTEIKVLVDLPSFAKRAAKTGIKKVGLTRIEGIIAESGKHPQYFVDQEEVKNYEDIIYKGIKDIAEYFDEMWVRTSDIRTNEYKNLEGAPQEPEDNPMLGMHGIRYGLKHPEILKAEFKALKRAAANKGTKMGFLLPQLISVEELKEVKKLLKEIEFDNVKVGVMIETPAAVQIIKSLCEEGLDFISFGTNDLTQYILAVDRGNSEVQNFFDEMHPAVTYQLGYVIRVCKRAGVETSICGQAGSEKPMVKYLVKQGIDSISVNADMAAEIADYVSKLEKGEDSDENPKKEKKEKTPDKQENKKNKNYESGEEAIKHTEKEKQEYEENHENKQEESRNENEENYSEQSQEQSPNEKENKDSQDNPLSNKALDELEKQKKKAEESGQKFSAQTNPPEKVEKNIQALNKEKQKYESSHSEESESNEPKESNKQNEEQESNDSEENEKGPLDTEGRGDETEEEEWPDENEKEKSNDEDEELHYEEPEYESYHTENLEEEVEDSEFPEKDEKNKESQENEEYSGKDNEKKKESEMGIFN